MAHHQPSHLARLIRSLSGDSAYFFIHIDRKSSLSSFKESIPESGRIVFLNDRERVYVNWGGFSQVLATLNLMETALGSGLDFGRYCLLSGSDYPIKKLGYIEDQLATDKEFIRIEHYLDGYSEDFFNRYIGFYWFQDNFLLRKARLSGKIRRKIYDKIGLYHGSQWWALTGQCVEYINGFLKQNRDYVNFHKHTVCSDEIFFHSIIKNSPFAKNITHDLTAPHDEPRCANVCIELNEHGCHYIDWSDSQASSPKVLDVSDFNRIMDSQALFARKFDEEKSKSLLELIDVELFSES